MTDKQILDLLISSEGKEWKSQTEGCSLKFTRLKEEPYLIMCYNNEEFSGTYTVLNKELTISDKNMSFYVDSIDVGQIKSISLVREGKMNNYTIWPYITKGK